MEKIKCEMHIHTKYSNDSFLNLTTLYLICKLKKIKCIAITDHNTIIGAKKFKDQYEKKGINVIIGEEIMTDSGEIVGLYLTKTIQKGLSLKTTIEEIKNQKGLIYVPHPYDEKRKHTVISIKNIEKYKKDIDFIECHNGRNFLQIFSMKQNEIAEKFSIHKIVGSDAHTILELGRNYMETIPFKNQEEFKLAISNARFSIKPCIRLSHKVTKIVKIIKLIIRGDIIGLFRTVNRRLRKEML